MRYPAAHTCLYPSPLIPTSIFSKEGTGEDDYSEELTAERGTQQRTAHPCAYEIAPVRIRLSLACPPCTYSMHLREPGVTTHHHANLCARMIV